MKRLIAFAPLALLALIVIAAAFVLTRGGPRDTISSGALGRLAPSYALTRLGGGDLVTSDAFAGRAYVVNFFASWCTPCRAEHPHLTALAAHGVAVLGVAYKDDAEDASRFLRELGDPFEAVALDPEGRFALEIGVAGAVPETFVIDGDGRIVAVHRGPLTAEIVERDIMPALAR
jgi:cytochrome c biogenesis protein CcmG/thiol:disulfide interchange protein DsbE